MTRFVALRTKMMSEAARCGNTERPLTHSSDCGREGLGMQPTQFGARRTHRPWRHRGDTWLYRLHCDHAALIYVGITSDLNRRMLQHKTTKPWWSEVHTVQAELFPTRQQALAAESWYITAYRPKYNTAGIPDDEPSFLLNPDAYVRVSRDQDGHFVVDDRWQV